jgi:regulator of sigma E protease
MSILIFFAVLFVLILVHEWGHFIVAKKTGMRVDEFGIGFPPKIFGIKKGETEYTLNSLPIGGFVRIYGENASDAAEDGAKGTDVSKSFTSKSKWAQAAVLIAGVTMNVVFAWLLYVGVFMYGVPTAVDESEATEKAQLVVTSVLKDSPAEKVGIVPGTVIKSYGGTELTPRAFSEFTKATSGNESLSIEVVNGKEKKNVSVEPKVGTVEGSADKAIGVSLALVETVKKPFFTALRDATNTTITSLGAIAVGLGSLIVDLFQNDADLSQVAGPIGIAGLVGDAAEFGFTSLLLFTAVISLNLAVINMLPFPALDGGRLLMVGIEAGIGRPINPVWVARVNIVGFASLLLLMVLVTWSDIAKLI